MTTNKTILDLSKVQHASFYYKSQWGDCRQRLPKTETVHNSPVGEHENALVYVGDNKVVTVNAIQLATQYGMLDIWTPHCKFQLTSNHAITYTGDKAVSLWEAWNERIFNTK